MDNSFASKLLSKIGLGILAIALFDLFFINWWILSRENQIKANASRESVNLSSPAIESNLEGQVTERPSPLPSGQVLVPSPTVKVETKTIVEKQTVIQNANREVFVPLGSGSTKSGSFEDLGGAEVTIDTSKYPQIESMIFEASVSVEGGNGLMRAQLKNVSDNNSFIESQLSTSSGTPIFKSSNKFPFVYGSKTYRVQAMTNDTNFSAVVSAARIKITLK